MRVHPLLAALLPALLAAGCVGAETPSSLAPTPPPTVADEPAEEPTTPAAAAAPTPRSVNFSFEGALAPAACVPTGVGACQGPPDAVPRAADDAHLPLDAAGTPLRLAATLTWTAATPLTGTLTLTLLQVRACGEGCIEGVGVQQVEGVSPLALEVGSLPPLAEGESFLLAVDQPSAVPAPLHGTARGDQAFRLDATLATLT